MKNKKIWLGLLVIVLVFGMTVIGCDNDTISDVNNSTAADTKQLFFGQWVGKAETGASLRFEITNSNWSLLSSFLSVMRTGTHTFKGERLILMENGKEVGMAMIEGIHLVMNIHDGNFRFVKSNF